MISRSALAALVAGLAFPVLSVPAAPDPVDVFVAEQFEQPVTGQELSVTGDVARVCRTVLGSAYPQGSIRYWRQSGRTVWVLSSRGKHGLITAGFVVDGGVISTGAVLADREQRGRPIRSRRFLRQFEGIGLREDGRLDKRVHGITGATISSNAMRNMALLALRLDRLRGAGAPPA